MKSERIGNMGNKLKNIFSNEEIIINETIKFKDRDAHERFIEALERVQEEGKSVRVEGIDSIDTIIRTGESIYPVASRDNISDFVVAPSIEEVKFELETEYGKKELGFNRFHINKGIVLETSEDAIVYLKFLFEKDTEKAKISYRAQPEKAPNIKEILECYSVTLSLFNRLFVQDISKLQNNIMIMDMKGYFEKAIERYKKLEFIEKEFNINFSPKELTTNKEDWLNLEEIYIILKEKQVVRSFNKIEEIEIKAMNVKQDDEIVNKGTKLDITFLSDTTFSLWNNTVNLYTACLITNAIVKEVKKLPNGEVNVLYGEEDSRPMYISYRGFKTVSEAEQEVSKIMNHKNEYVNALTVTEHIKRSILND